MPASSAERTHATAVSFSTCEPWVSQLPYVISEILRPELPRYLNSMDLTLRGLRGVLAPGHHRLRQARAADLERPEHPVADDARRQLVVGEPGVQRLLQLPGQDEAVGEAEQDSRAEHCRRDELDLGRLEEADEHDGERDDQEVLPDVAAGIDVVADEPADRALVARGQVPLVAGHHRLADLHPLGLGRLPGG